MHCCKTATYLDLQSPGAHHCHDACTVSFASHSLSLHFTESTHNGPSIAGESAEDLELQSHGITVAAETQRQATVSLWPSRDTGYMRHIYSLHSDIHSCFGMERFAGPGLSKCSTHHFLASVLGRKPSCQLLLHFERIRHRPSIFDRPKTIHLRR